MNYVLHLQYIHQQDDITNPLSLFPFFRHEQPMSSFIKKLINLDINRLRFLHLRCLFLPVDVQKICLTIKPGVWVYVLNGICYISQHERPLEGTQFRSWGVGLDTGRKIRNRWTERRLGLTGIFTDGGVSHEYFRSTMVVMVSGSSGVQLPIPLWHHGPVSCPT